MKDMVIGLDAASPSLIDRWADHLPNIRSLCSTGVHVVLNYIVAPSSIPAWQCFPTGTHSAKYEVDVPLTKPSEMKGGEEAYLIQVERLHTKSVDSAKLLLEWYKPELFVMTLQGIDLVQHDFSRYMNQPGSEHTDVVRDWYIKVDQAVGELRRLATQDTTFLILSDHGSIPISTSFHVNEYLRSQGILRTNQTTERRNHDLNSSLRKLI